MTVYDREYVARFAPVTQMSHHALERRNELPESWSPTALRSMSADPIPVRLSHDKSEQGVVGWLGTRYVDDGWHHATFKLDPSRPLSPVALDRLKLGTPVSMSFCGTGRDEWVEEAGAGARRWTHSYLTELSVLAADERPAITGAQIIRIREPDRRDERTRLAELNAALERLGIPGNLKPLPTLPNSDQEIIHTPPARLVQRARTDPDNHELDELRRRMDFCPDAPMELIIKNMTIEMQLGRRNRRVA